MADPRCGCAQSTPCSAFLEDVDDSTITVSGAGTEGDPYVISQRSEYAQMQLAVDQSITDNTLTVVSWDTEVTNPFAMWTIANDSRIVAISPGWFSFTATVVWNNENTGYRFARFIKNGSGAVPLGASRLDANESGVLIHQIAGGCELAAGDYIEIEVLSSSDAAAAVAADTTIQMHRALPLAA